eukprot:Pgem_evm1s5560
MSSTKSNLTKSQILKEENNEKLIENEIKFNNPTAYEDVVDDDADSDDLEHELCNKDGKIKVQKFHIGYKNRKFPDAWCGQRIASRLKPSYNILEKPSKYVLAMMDEKDALELYKIFAEKMVESRTKRKRYTRNTILQIVDQHQQRFREKGIRVVLCSHTVWYYVSTGKGGYMQRVCYKWIEYIDLDCRPGMEHEIVQYAYAQKTKSEQKQEEKQKKKEDDIQKKKEKK